MTLSIDYLLALTDEEEIRSALRSPKLKALQDGEHNEGILLNALRYRKNQALIEILIEQRIQITARGVYGVTPLMLANAEVTKLLVEQGAPVDAVDAEGRSALMHAVEAADFDKVEYLVAQGADTQLRDSEGLTAAGYADRWGFHLPVLKAQVPTRL